MFNVIPVSLNLDIAIKSGDPAEIRFWSIFLLNLLAVMGY